MVFLMSYREFTQPPGSLPEEINGSEINGSELFILRGCDLSRSAARTDGEVEIQLFGQPLDPTSVTVGQATFAGAANRL